MNMPLMADGTVLWANCEVDWAAGVQHVNVPLEICGGEPGFLFPVLRPLPSSPHSAQVTWKPDEGASKRRASHEEPTFRSHTGLAEGTAVRNLCTWSLKLPKTTKGLNQQTSIDVCNVPRAVCLSFQGSRDRCSIHLMGSPNYPPCSLQNIQV